MSPRPKLILLEFNEINWRLVDPLLAAGEMPQLAAMIRHGARAAPVATETTDNLEPWITWVSLHTGQPQRTHGVRVLEPPPETIRHPRSWEIVAEAGRSYGIFATPSSWPPRDDAAFYVPGNFSRDTATHPESLRPIQDLNCTYSRQHNPLERKEGLGGMLRRGLGLARLGLRPGTVATLASQLLLERVTPDVAWKKVALQPIVNIDFFERLWRRHRPDFATFHTNHVAHYMHRYWRAHDPAAFPGQEPDAEERERYGGAITFGHRVADRVLGRVRRFVDDDTVVVLASSMGQRPYLDARFADGKPATRLRSIERILELMGLAGRVRPVAVMAPQWNLECRDEQALREVLAALEASVRERDGRAEGRLIHFEEHGGTVTITPAAPERGTEGLVAVVADGRGGTKRHDWDELLAQQDTTTKEGYHDPEGLLVIEGPGVAAGARAGACTHLDVLPTMLDLMGLEVPASLPGRVLEEIGTTRPLEVASPAPL